MRVREAIIFGSFACSIGAAVFVSAQQSTPPATAQDRGQGRTARQGAAVEQARTPNFPQQTRKLAPPEVIARGKAVFEVNCTACHGKDLRGGDMGGPSLLRSQVALNDEHGELISPIVHGSRQGNGMPSFNLSDEDTTAVAEYIHSVLAEVGRQGRPPGADKIPDLKVIVGDPTAGHAYFQANCSSCHSATGDLSGIATKISDPRNLQNTWVSGIVSNSNALGGGFGDTHPAGTTVRVTFPDGKSVQGPLIEANEFLVALTLPDGTRGSYSRENGNPKVEVHEPNDAHKKLATTLNDKDMHNVTAYLATLK